MSRRVLRFVVLRFVVLALICVVSGTFGLAPAASASGGNDSSTSVVRPREAQPIDAASTELAMKYRPFIGIQTQAEPCGPGEAFLPTDALAIIHRPDVVLRDTSGAVIATAPTPTNLASAPADTNIDFPGSALAINCDVETWFRAAGPPPPMIYGRVLVDPDDPRFTVLQYWFFWLYNDWNNRHEGDWEMMQIIFDAASPEAALATQPTTVVVAQHDGAQKAPWAQVEMRSGRPIVYAARGSHATFFKQDRWIGKGPATGFGCDDTRGPTTTLDPAVLMMPAAVDPAGESAWMLWQGRWGERRPSFNNGSEGPASTPQWNNPIAWTNEFARNDSLRAPDFGNAATDFFCNVTERGSVLMIKFFDSALLVGGLIVALVALVVIVGRRTRWSPRVPQPVSMRRRSGQVLSSAASLLIAERRRFISIAALVLAGGVVASLLREALLKIPVLHDASLLLAGDSVSGSLFALLAGAMITIPVGIVAIALATAVAVDVDADDPSSVRSVPDLARRAGVWRVALIIAIAAVLLGPISFLIGVYLVTRWVAAPTLALGGESVRQSLRASSALTRGHRTKTGVVLMVAATIAVALGPFIGTLVLILSGTSFAIINVVASLVTAVLLPWLAIVIVMVHANLAAGSTKLRTDGRWSSSSAEP